MKKNIFKCLGIAALACTIGLQTTYAANTCEPGEVEHTDYFLFLDVNTKQYLINRMNSLGENEILTFVNGASKKNNVKLSTIISQGPVAIVKNGSSTDEGAEKSWTAVQFWQNYYKAISVGASGDFVYTDQDNNSSYIYHGEWWKYKEDGKTIDKSYGASDQTPLITYLRQEYNGLSSTHELIANGTNVPSSDVDFPALGVSTGDKINWKITRRFSSEDASMSGVLIGSSEHPSIYSPAAAYVTYCVKETNNPGGNDPENPGENPPVTEFKVMYDANGGKNAPATQTGTANNCVTVSSDKPTLTGNKFLGWSRKKDAAEADNAYSPGSASYCGDEGDIVLYAVWQTNTGIGAHVIVFGAIVLIAGTALVIAKRKNAFRQI